MRKGYSPEMDETQGFQYLGHSNWAICSPLSQFCSENFPTFSLSYWEANSYYPRERKAENEKRVFTTRNGWDTGVSVPGAFKLGHVQPFKPILLRNFSNFFSFILGGQLLLPQREEDWKRKRGIHQEWMRDRGSVPGAFKLDHLQQIKPILFPKFSNFFTIILGGQFLLPHRGEGWKWENGNLPTRVKQRVFSAWGIQFGPLAAD